MISAYSFGSITVNGTTYTSDVIIGPAGVLSPWWRREGHTLQPADLATVTASVPQILVIGTGAYGVMKVPEATLDFLNSISIEPRPLKTGAAVEEFNSLLRKLGPQRIMAALHLTC